MTPTTSAVFVNADNGMQYHGKILQLRKFQGPITIANNFFENNNLAISDCSVYNNADMKNPKSKKYPLYKDSFNNLQIKNLISIRQNQFTIKIVENIFTKNSAVKGLVYIENLKEFTTQRQYVVIYGNIFNYTATFFANSAIFIRSEAN